MATLKDTIISGDLNISGNIEGIQLFTKTALKPKLINTTTTTSPSYGSTFRALAQFTRAGNGVKRKTFNGFYVFTCDYQMALFVINNITNNDWYFIDSPWGEIRYKIYEDYVQVEGWFSRGLVASLYRIDLNQK